MTPTEKANATVMLDIFSAIERREPQRLAELCHPDVEFCWPAALPYGGTPALVEFLARAGGRAA